MPLKQTIENYEPRADVIDVIVSAFPDEHAYTVSLVFYTNNLKTPTTLELTLYRVR